LGGAADAFGVDFLGGFLFGGVCDFLELFAGFAFDGSGFDECGGE